MFFFSTLSSKPKQKCVSLISLVLLHLSRPSFVCVLCRGADRRGGSNRCCLPRWIWRCRGELKTMGKSNSKLKPELVEELTRKTYCKCFCVCFPFCLFSERKSLTKCSLSLHEYRNVLAQVKRQYGNINLTNAALKSYYLSTVFHTDCSIHYCFWDIL